MLDYSSTTKHLNWDMHQHGDAAEPASTRAVHRGSTKKREAPGAERVGVTTSLFLWVLRTEGPGETSAVPLCWEHRAHVWQQGQGWELQGWGWQAERSTQGSLPSVLLISVQPKPICTEGVESLKRKQEALSKKASSVLRWCNHVRNPKRHRHLQKSRR